MYGAQHGLVHVAGGIHSWKLHSTIWELIRTNQ